MPLLSDDFLAPYKTKTPPWGPLGWVTYKRTYARWLPNEGRTEQWWETIRRVVEGNLSIIPDDPTATKEEAEALYDAFFNMYVLPPGRGLWMMGTDVAKRSGESLFNCWNVTVKPQAYFEDGPVKPSTPFVFMADMSMLGGGVGFNVSKESVGEFEPVSKNVSIYITCDPKHANVRELDAETIPTDKSSFVYVRVADTRRGWTDAIRYTIDAAWKQDDYDPVIVFDVSDVRKAGTRIKGFGGTAAGPGPLVKCLRSLNQILNARVGQNLRPIDALDMMNVIGKCVVSGNVRRSAQIAVGDIDDRDFRDAKLDEAALMDRRWASNNSVLVSDDSDLSEVVKTLIQNGEPGLVNLERGRNYGRYADGFDPEADPHVSGVNPCLDGDTLVATADGRGAVSIRELASAGEDVPVYCVDESDNLTISMMRNPRITGYGEKMFKITLDSGDTLRVTGNHKFRSTNGDYIAARDLVPGDSLKSYTRQEASIKDIFGDAASKSQDYFWWSYDGKKGLVADHRMIAAFHHNLDEIPVGSVVHHCDFDAQNNRPGNLQIMSKADHDRLHGDAMRGDRNPMRRAAVEWSEEKWATHRAKMSDLSSGESNHRFSGWTHEQIRQQALDLTVSLGRRVSFDEWQAHCVAFGVPQSFSSWRKQSLGSVSALLKWAALEAGLEHAGEDPRVARTYERAIGQGYDAFIEGGVVLVDKQCEVCSSPFVHPFSQREVSVCGRACANTRKAQSSDTYKKIGETHKAAAQERHKETRVEQVRVFLDLRFELERDPLKREWVDKCRSQSVSAEIGRKSSPFLSWASLKEAASVYNHRVVSIEFDGHDDVYNGTVDEFHNFLVGGFEGKSSRGKPKMTFFENKQCGEIFLESMEPCNLVELFPSRILQDNLDAPEFAALALRYAKRVTFSKMSWHQSAKVIAKNRRVGVSISGWDDFKLMHSGDPNAYLDGLYSSVRDADIAFSNLLGCDTSIKTTTNKPSGSISNLPGVSHGRHRRYSKWYIRRIRMASTDPLVEVLTDAGFPIESDLYVPNTEVVSFPVESPTAHLPGFVSAGEDTIEAQFKDQWDLQTWWADNSVSSTITFHPHEVGKIEGLLKQYPFKSTSLLPYSGHGYEQAPFEPISEEQYHELMEQIRFWPSEEHMDRERRDMELLSDDECAGGACPIR